MESQTEQSLLFVVKEIQRACGFVLFIVAAPWVRSVLGRTFWLVFVFNIIS